MKETRGNRLHIAFFGKTNVGKSTIVNKIIGQEFSIVSEIKGTTTDVNQKSMELLPIGPVTILDTAGYDDDGALGGLRIEKTLKILNKTDVAVVIFDNTPVSPVDIEFLEVLKDKNIKVLAIFNKTDLGLIDTSRVEKYAFESFKTSAISDGFVSKFKESLLGILPNEFKVQRKILEGLIKPFDTVLMVIPLDNEAPKGRLILPQVNVLREILDSKAMSLVCTDENIEEALNGLKFPPNIVVCDSSVFQKVNAIVPKNIPMTSFSILFARLKGDLDIFVDGALKLDEISDVDKILVLESCSHHPAEDDIGRVKIPNLIRKFTGANPKFNHYAGCDMPDNISDYSLVVHCGACMTNRTEMLSRIALAKQSGVSITNYGIAIAKCLGILDRAIKPLVIKPLL